MLAELSFLLPCACARRAGAIPGASLVESGGKKYRFVKGKTEKGEEKKKQKKQRKKIYNMDLATDDVISVIGNCRVLSTAKALLN